MIYFIPFSAEDGVNKLVSSIWDSHNRRREIILNQKQQDASLVVPPETPPSGILGVDFSGTGYEDNVDIEKAFLELGESQLPVVQGGWYLGDFSTSAGFEIILESVGNNFTFGEARLEENLISIPKLGSGPTNAELFENRMVKEQLLKYVDPTSFWSAFYNSKLRVWENNRFNAKKEDELYDDVLSLHYTKNHTYIVIKNEKNKSFDFFGNYSSTIKLGTNDQNVADKEYRTSDGWPLITLTNNDFVTGNASERNKLHFQLPIGDNRLPALFYTQAYEDDGKDSASFPDKFTNSYIELNYDDQITPVFTELFNAIVPNQKGATDTTVINTWNQINYLQRYDRLKYPQVSEGINLKSAFLLDNVFAPFDMDVFSNIGLDTSVNNTLVKVFNEDIYFDDSRYVGWQFMGSIGMSITHNADLTQGKVILFAFPRNIISYYDPVVSKLPTINSGYLEVESDYLGEVVFQNSPTLYYKLDLEDGTTEEVLKTALAGFNSKFQISPEDIFALSFSQQEFEDLKTLKNNSAFLSGFPVYLGLQETASEVDVRGILYRKYQIVLNGFIQNGSEIEIDAVESTVELNFIEGTL